MVPMLVVVVVALLRVAVVVVVAVGVGAVVVVRARSAYAVPRKSNSAAARVARIAVRRRALDRAMRPRISSRVPSSNVLNL